MVVLVTGATGLIGSILCQKLIAEHHEVRILSRKEQKINNLSCFLWAPERGEIDERVFDGIDAIIHLAGANIFEKRWSQQRKKTIIDSRVETANLLYAYCNKIRPSLKLFITASAVGWYGFEAKGTCDENRNPGKDYLAEVCVDWEAAADKFNNLKDCKVAKVRTPMVLAKNAISYILMKKTVDYYLGSILGSGNQFTPWVHINDLCELYVAIVGGNVPLDTYNCVAPEKITYKQMMCQMAIHQHKKIVLPNIPAVLLKLILGERANLLLTNQKINVNKLISTGFIFRYPTLQKALDDFSHEK